MPNGVVSLIVLAVAVSPGYVHHRVRQRFMLRENRSSTAELVELFSAGALSTTVSAVLVLACGGFAPFLVSLNGLVSGVAYSRNHPWQILASVLLILTMSVGIGALAGRLVGRWSGRQVGTVQEGTAWVRALTREYRGEEPYLAVELDDGRLVEGYLLAVSTDEDPDRRDMMLQGPLFFTGPGGEPRKRSHAAYVMVPGHQVHLVHAQYAGRKKS